LTESDDRKYQLVDGAQFQWMTIVGENANGVTWYNWGIFPAVRSTPRLKPFENEAIT
jgi:hypothetical protein